MFRSVVQWVAEPGPRPTCRSIEVSLLDRIDSLTTLASNSKGSPASNNGIELIFRAVLFGWIGTPAKPAAETMRPQFGSPPVIAVLTKLLSAMLRAIASASAWVLAPWTQISIRCVAPSPSSGIIFARSMHSSVSSASNVARSASLSEGCLAEGAWASKTRESLVLMWPSTLMQLNDRFAAACKSRCARVASMGASVTTIASMVAIFGPIIPAPLHMPTIACEPCEVVTFRWAVFRKASVVMIPSQASRK